MRKLEVRAFSRRQHAGYGYTGYVRADVQQLGYHGPFGWVSVDEEIIPSEVGIEKGALGAYTGKWRSKFINWIPEAQGGRAEQFA